MEEPKGVSWGCPVLCACLLRPWAVRHGGEGRGPFLWCSVPAQRAAEKLRGCLSAGSRALLLPPVGANVTEDERELTCQGTSFPTHITLSGAEGVGTGIGRPRFCLGCAGTVRQLLIRNFLTCKMRNMLSFVLSGKRKILVSRLSHVKHLINALVIYCNGYQGSIPLSLLQYFCFFSLDVRLPQTRLTTRCAISVSPSSNGDLTSVLGIVARRVSSTIKPFTPRTRIDCS